MGNILLPQFTRSVLCNEITPLVTLCISCDDLREECVLVCVCDTHTSGQSSITSISRACPAITQPAAGGSGINKQSWQAAWMDSNWSLSYILPSMKSGPKRGARTLPLIPMKSQPSVRPRQRTKGTRPEAWKEISISQIETQRRASTIVFKHSDGVCLFVYLAASMAIRTIRTASFSQRECKWEKLFLSLFCVLFCFLCLWIACKSRNVKSDAC